MGHMLASVATPLPGSSGGSRCATVKSRGGGARRSIGPSGNRERRNRFSPTAEELKMRGDKRLRDIIIGAAGLVLFIVSVWGWVTILPLIKETKYIFEEIDHSTG